MNFYLSAFFILFCLTLNAKEFVLTHLAFICSKTQLHHEKRRASLPYISGDTFRSFAKFVVDEARVPFDPSKLEPGDTIFVNADYMHYFFNTVHPAITTPYILITHNSIKTMPGEFIKYLNDEKLIAWFAKNIGREHPKLFPIPIGFANAYWPHGNTKVVDEVLSEKITKDKLIYINFDPKTNSKARNKVQNYFKGKSFCYFTGRKNFKGYLRDLARSKFVVSPLGSGFDCHRSWEALVMGAIPIIESSSIDPLFEELPVIIVKNWSIITKEFLEQKYKELQNKKYNYDKLFAQYWFNQIITLQKNI